MVHASNNPVILNVAKISIGRKIFQPKISMQQTNKSLLYILLSAQDVLLYEKYPGAAKRTSVFYSGRIGRLDVYQTM